MRLFYFICFLLLSSFLVTSCSKNEQAVEEEIFLGVGKWKIKKGRVSSFKKDACDVTDLILNSDSSFKIYISDNTVLIGTYSVVSSDFITLSSDTESNIGELTNIKIEANTISFEINLKNSCTGSLEGEKDEDYEESKTYIADVEFEKYLIEQGYDNVLDNFVSSATLAEIEYLDLNKRGIRSLVGIEDFVNLQGITAQSNQIEGVLDMSYNTQLFFVDFPDNPIQALYLRNNPSLKDVWIYGTNTLEVIEILNSPELTSLTVHNNKLKELDVSNLTNLVNLRIWDSDLEELDLTNLSKLEYLVAFQIFTTSGNLLSLPANPSSLKVLEISNNALNEVDLSGSTNLDRVSLGNNNLTDVDFSKNTKIEFLDVSFNNLNSLDVSSIENLFWFRARGNPFQCVTVSEAQLSAIPSNCETLGIPEYSELEEESCYNNWAWIDKDGFPNTYEISSTWVVNGGAYYSLDCN